MDPIQAAITEIWALYAVGTCLIASRLFARIKLVGFRGLQPDDVLAIFAWMCYTSVSVVGHVFILYAKGKHTSQLSLQDRIDLPPSEYAAYEFGSKMFLVGETLYLGTVWTLKLCMAFFYRRLVRGLWSEKLILPLLAGIGATGLAGILTIYLTCTPVSKHWQILPYPGGICVPQNPWTFITIMGLNLATDLCILSLPVPVLAKMRTNVLRKIGLVFLFGLGLFTMVAAVVRIVSIFVLDQESAGALWSIREDFIAVVVTQAPMVYPLFGRKFWETAYGSGHGTSDDSVKHNPNNKSGGATGESHELTFGSATMNRVKRPKDPYSLTQLGITQVGGSESQEEMILSPTNGSSGGGAVKANGTTVSIEATNSNSDNEKPGLTRTLSLKSRKGRASEKEKPHGNNTVMVEHCVTTTTSHCPEEQKRRDIENSRKQPWET
ncbi:integral membrane protein PTH11 [Apiospora arundinis]|uniref:Integral membrane protein PTH11 n=1 Tax=Apiospora arundinis TaxID=335852 RepID=A0ABR2HUR4_9PEZI